MSYKTTTIRQPYTTPIIELARDIMPIHRSHDFPQDVGTHLHTSQATRHEIETLLSKAEPLIALQHWFEATSVFVFHHNNHTRSQ